MAPKTDLFKKLYIETIIRNPKKVGFSGHRLGLGCLASRPKGGLLYVSAWVSRVGFVRPKTYPEPPKPLN